MIQCPICKKGKLNFESRKHEIPYFGEVIETLVYCPICGYKHVDTLTFGEKEPVRYILKVSGEEDLKIRVVRSSRCRIKIPELGVTVTPGAYCEGFISNVEGVLCRIEDVVKFASRWNEKKANKLLLEIDKIKKGKKEIHLIFEDPTGNSAIISKKVRKEKLEI